MGRIGIFKAVSGLVMLGSLYGCPPWCDPIITPCPPPQATVRPDLPVQTLRETDPPEVVAQALKESLQLLMYYAIELETLLEGYR